MAKKRSTKYRVKSNKTQVSQLLTAIVYIAIGVLFCVFRSSVLSWLVYIIGGLLIVKGVVDLLVSKLTVLAAVEIALGILTIVLGVAVANALAVIIGLIIIAYGLTGLLSQLKNSIALIVNVLFVVAGVLLVLNPSGGIAWLFIVIGIVFIVDGVLAFVKAVR